MSELASQDALPRSHTWLGLGLALSCAYLLVLVLVQPTVTVADGRGWDGRFYYRMAASDLPNSEVRVPHRYKARLLVPTAARALSDLTGDWTGSGAPLLLAFSTLNLAAGLVAALLTWLFLARLHGERLGLAALALCWLLIVATHVSPLPESAWYPTLTDPVSSLFLLLALYLALCEGGAATPLHCALVFALGTTTREHFGIFGILFLLRVDLAASRERLLGAHNRGLALRGAGALVGSLLGLLLLVQWAGVNPLEGRADYAFSQYTQLQLVTVGAGLVNVYGGLLLVLLALRIAAPRAVLGTHPLGVSGPNLALVVGILTVISFGWSNTERFLYWALPTLVFCFAREIDAGLRSGPAARIAIACAAALALVVNRSLLPIEPSGLASCSVGAILDGNAVWLGHWLQTCGPPAELRLVLAYLLACAVVAAIAAACRMRRA